MCNISYHSKDNRVIKDMLSVFIHSHDEWFVKSRNVTGTFLIKHIVIYKSLFEKVKMNGLGHKDIIIIIFGVQWSF
jgi:hypothetical protein